MSLLWQFEEGHFACRRWVEVGVHSGYHPRWMEQASQPQSGYLSPLPDFSTRSPFGGGSCFQPRPADRG